MRINPLHDQLQFRTIFNRDLLWVNSQNFAGLVSKRQFWRNV